MKHYTLFTHKATNIMKVSRSPNTMFKPLGKTKRRNLKIPCKGINMLNNFIDQWHVAVTF